MGFDQSQRLEGAKIFIAAVEYIKKNGWNHNSMEILLQATPNMRWKQPMAIYMFIELSHELKSETLTKFDERVSDVDEVIDLFMRVAKNLSQ